jgi:hypothetical protein
LFTPEEDRRTRQKRRKAGRNKEGVGEDKKKERRW